MACKALTFTLLLSLNLATAIPLRARHATLKGRGDLLDEYDFIVVGAGTAGLTVADRLSENGEFSVLVVEYGYLDHSPSITHVGGPRDLDAPADEYLAATRMYNISSVPQPGLKNTRKPAFCGAVVGESSAVNGMVFDRGSAEDYDAMLWSTSTTDDEGDAAYAETWGWDNIIPYFKKSVTFHPPPEKLAEEFEMTWDEDAAYGGSTPIHSSFAPFQWGTTRVQFEAFKAIPGVEAPVEGAGGRAVGVFWIPNSINPATRTRSYSMLGHYENEGGPESRENFHLLPGNRVTQIVLGENDEDQDELEDRPLAAQSVIIKPRDGPLPDTPLEIKARREVVVSAGTFHTPQVLQRSGIGPRAVLEAAGVEVQVELSGVGLNLQDHPNIATSYRYETDVWPNPSTLASNQTFASEALELWRANKTGPHSAYVNSGAFLPLSVYSKKSEEIISAILEQDPVEYLPEVYEKEQHEGYKAQLKALIKQFKGTDSAILELPFSGQAGLNIVHLKQLSRGTVLLNKDDDWDGRGDVEPDVDYRTFSNPIDEDFVVEMLKFTRHYHETEVMAQLGPVETAPGPNLVPFETEDSTEMEEAAKEWIRGRMSPSTGHPVGTAAMAPLELGGVVGPDLRVHKVGKLSVVDNSIMTLVPGTHTSSSAYMIGEKAADLILDRFPIR
ncbi:hypothetical protein AJ80_08978 [Polytolypa hystricis UAMH7299]|uniref:Glucose-methanol-choline oxidoreductase N-terminal domain-containing protein n=1 Tax=Polytolypa hystricis (strain UAMH7299) TaxID=1447883 RepID=A0A2B7WYQ8_POLH7|nr:hypothetical protein AJ80_08978 [Polytolypa hystricis UAMH7299]